MTSPELFPDLFPTCSQRAERVLLTATCSLFPPTTWREQVAGTRATCSASCSREVR